MFARGWWITFQREVDFFGHSARPRYISLRRRTRKCTAKRKTAPVSEPDFFEAKALRSNEMRAGRKSAASDQAIRN